MLYFAPLRLYFTNHPKTQEEFTRGYDTHRHHEMIFNNGDLFINQTLNDDLIRQVRLQLPVGVLQDTKLVLAIFLVSGLLFTLAKAILIEM